MRLHYLVLILILVEGLTLFSQETEGPEYQQLHMLRLKQENDLYQYWYKSDKNFTDGIHIEVAHKVFSNKVSDWFLIGLEETPFNDFSLSIGQDIFTPENTDTTEVDSTDRPYTALLYFTYSKYSNNLFKGKKVVSNFYFGLQGKGAFGAEVQNGVHDAIDNPTAKGWDNQLGTGLMLDYDLTYHQLIPFGNKFFESNYFGKAHIGTIYNFISAGLNFKIGHYSDSYLNFEGIYDGRNKTLVTEKNIHELSKAKRKLMPKRIGESNINEQIAYLNERMNRKLQFFIYLNFHSTYTIYDGTTEGSLIPFEKNKYEYATANEERLVFEGEYGINIQYGHFMFAYNRFLENDAYNEGDFFGYGEIELNFIFY